MLAHKGSACAFGIAWPRVASVLLLGSAICAQSPSSLPWCEVGGSGGPACVGTWDGPYTWPPTACATSSSDPLHPCYVQACSGPFGEIPHAVLILQNAAAHLADPLANPPQWKVLLVNAASADSLTQPWWLWDPAMPGALLQGSPNVPKVLFCGGHTVLANGIVFFAGGQQWPAAGGSCIPDGANWAYRYDPNPLLPGPGQWSASGTMLEDRYYPSTLRVPFSLTSPLDRVLVMTGDAVPTSFEVYNPGSGTWEPAAAPAYVHSTKPDCLMVYHKGHWIPSASPATSRGEVFFSSPYEYDPSGINNCTVGVVGQVYETQRLILPPSGVAGHSWTIGPAPQTDSERTDNCSVLIVLDEGAEPGLAEPEVQVVMGVGHQFEFVPPGPLNQPSKTVELVKNPHKAGSTWMELPSLVRPRFHAVFVLLPGRKLLALGGRDNSFSNPLLTPELIDLINPELPALEWDDMADHVQRREYHSVALLLPDGRVLHAGGRAHSADPAYYHAEVFSPPTLYRGRRPVLGSSTPNTMTYGGFQDLQVSGVPAAEVASFELLMPGSVTHSTEFDQRLVVLRAQDLGGGTFRVYSPTGADVAPPGWYMLFAVSDKGVPSTAKPVKVL